nr:unnamed protein product [Callosobruchus chinensis]
MIWHEHVSSIETAAGEKLGYLFRARKYFSQSNLLTLYKVLDLDLAWSIAHTFGELLPLIRCLYLMQSREGQFDSIGDPALTCHLQPLSHRRAVGESHSSTGIQTDSAPTS